MERDDIRTSNSVEIQTPLLQATQIPELQLLSDDEENSHLDNALQRLEFFLALLGFRQTSILSCGISWLVFSLVCIVIPVILLELSYCAGCEKCQIKEFEFDCLASQACLGAVSSLCLAHNLKKYGIRKFLFVDQNSGHTSRFMGQYILRIRVIHFDDYCKCLEIETDTLILMEEHMRLRQNLSKISHKFRIYLLLVLLVVTASQLVTLLQITRFSGNITLLNGGDFAMTSVVQVVGIILCLHGATKISHRAQNVGSVASKWHALQAHRSSGIFPQSKRPNRVNNLETSNAMTSHSRLLNSANDLESSSQASPHSFSSENMGNLEISNLAGGRILTFCNSESDIESLDALWMVTRTELVSLVASYHKNESFVMYLHSNPGGITIYGWTVDRTLICTIFFIELSLVLFLLGNTTVV